MIQILDLLEVLLPIVFLACIAYIVFSWRCELDQKTLFTIIETPRIVSIRGGERLSVRAHASVRARSVRASIFVGADPTPTIIKSAEAFISRQASTWAERLISAEEAVMPSSWGMLEAMIRSAETPQFTIENATVISVERIVTETPKPQEEEEPEETPPEKARRNYSCISDTLDALKSERERMEREHPEFINDPDITECLQERFKDDKVRAVDPGGGTIWPSRKNGQSRHKFRMRGRS